jgi:hypothetical protein
MADEKKALDQISESLRESTLSGTLKLMIKNYMPIQKTLDRTRFELNQVQIKYEKLCRSLQNIEDEKERIQNFIKE